MAEVDLDRTVGPCVLMLGVAAPCCIEPDFLLSGTPTLRSHTKIYGRNDWQFIDKQQPAGGKAAGSRQLQDAPSPHGMESMDAHR